MPVRVVKRRGRTDLVLRYPDPLRPGKTKEEPAGTSRRRDAERKAALLSKELTEKTAREGVLWWAFVERFRREYVDGLREPTRTLYRVAPGHFEDLIGPVYMADATAEPDVSGAQSGAKPQRRKKTRPS